jgi:hypothetical protein
LDGNCDGYGRPDKHYGLERPKSCRDRREALKRLELRVTRARKLGFWVGSWLGLIATCALLSQGALYDDEFKREIERLEIYRGSRTLYLASSKAREAVDRSPFQ